jgi:phytanoyl-CoA hydroxylase
VELGPGDVLFCHGALVHGSAPNMTADRFRRPLIGHYIEGDAEQVAEYHRQAQARVTTGPGLGLPVDLGRSSIGDGRPVWNTGGR